MDRRSVLLGGAALAACAAQPKAPIAPEAQSRDADAAFRELAERLGADAVSAPDRAAALRGVARAALSPQARIVLDGSLQGAEAEAALAGFGFDARRPLYTVTSRSGVYRSLNTATAEDIQRETALLEARAADGEVAPAFVIDNTIAAIERTRTAQAIPASLDDALARQITALHTLRDRAPSGDGVWRMPRGAEYYAHQLSYALGASTDPAAAHAKVLKQCHDFSREADALLRELSLNEGSPGARLAAFMRNERYLYPDSDAGKNAAVTYMNMRLLRARECMPRAFAAGLEQTPAQVVRMSASDEAAHAAGRREGQSYIVDLTHIRNRPSWTLPSVVHHELLPGHLLQAPLGDAAHAPRLQQRYASGYNEGWAIYAERLMDELGAFEDDKLARLGYLQWMLFRIGRVVADTGIHVMRWSRERAITEMRNLQGDSIAFISIEDDVERFCLQPGMYAAQGLAALQIHDLRESVKRRIGARFDLPKFHDAMLRHGALSPPGLTQAANVAFS